jgi:hypothetical protein
MPNQYPTRLCACLQLYYMTADMTVTDISLRGAVQVPTTLRDGKTEIRMIWHLMSIIVSPWVPQTAMTRIQITKAPVVWNLIGDSGFNQEKNG